MYQNIKNAILKVKGEYESDHFNLVLEDDFLARTYFYLLRENYDLLNKNIFLKTRLIQNTPELKPFKWDLVEGILYEDNIQKYVIPKMVRGFKIYTIGFSAQQLSKRREHATFDI